MTRRLSRGFFHRELSQAEVEKLLNENPYPGSFLVRPSRSKSDTYVLSARRTNGEIIHLRIQRTNDGFNLGEGQECFPTLYDLIEYYHRNNGSLRDKNNEIIELTTPILAKLPTLEKYYHGPITHAHAFSLIGRATQIGTFLVRDSEGDPGDYVICVKTEDDITNIKIKCSRGYWFLAGTGQREQIDRFKSLEDLIQFYLKHNILIGVNQATYRLVQPYPTNWFYARDIHQRCDLLSKLSDTHIQPKSGFSLEFQLLNQESEYQSSHFHKRIGELPENRSRNRFKNILPYDETRVVLRNYPSTDYMNANRIRPPFNNVRREYIATQGPLPATVNDFWHMVQQEYVTCIVMITREVENARNKCAKYWPDVYTKKSYGNVIVENLGEYSYSASQSETAASRAARATLTQSPMFNDFDCAYRLRKLRITAEGGSQWDIAHWQYLAWGDHDSPIGTNQQDNQQLSILYNFFRNFGSSSTNDGDLHPRPIIIHCSAGIGRSGSTIAIDIILNRIENEGLNIEIDVPSLVKHMRQQRPGLVQTERQYELIYRLIEYFVEQLPHPSTNLAK